MYGWELAASIRRRRVLTLRLTTASWQRAPSIKLVPTDDRWRLTPRDSTCVYMLSSKVHMLPMGAFGFCMAFNASLCCEVLCAIRNNCPPGRLEMSQLKWVHPKSI